MNAIRFRSAVGAIGVGAALLALGASSVSKAADACEMAKLLASDGTVADEFGYSVTISGDVAVIGAASDDDAGYWAGSAYVYRWNGSVWVEEAKLFASDADVDSRFGFDVSLDGDVLAVSALIDDDYGAVYMFRWNGSSWIEEAKLQPSPLTPYDYFGHSVDLDGDVLVVGATYDDTMASQGGAVYVFRWDGGSWVQEAKLFDHTAPDSGQFGWTVAVDGDVIVGGMPYDDALGAVSGSARVFQWDGFFWNIGDKLLGSDVIEQTFFGGSVAVEDDVVVVGARSYDAAGPAFGATYVFRWNGSTWVEEAKLLASDGTSYSFLGCSVAISDDVIISGAYADDETGSQAGAAYAFQRIGELWVEQAKLLPADGAAYDHFGDSVAVSGDVAVISSIQDSDNGELSGSAYIFGGVAFADCNANGQSDGCEIFSGAVSDFNANAVPDDCPDELFVYNLTADTLHPTIAEAIDQAVSGHDLVATSLAFQLEPDIDFEDKAITLSSVAGIDQAAGGLIILADGARLETATDGATIMGLSGELRVEGGDSADLESDSIDFHNTGQVICRASSRLDVTAGATWLWGTTRVHEQATLMFSGPVCTDGATTVSPGGTFMPNGGLLASGPLIVDAAELSIGESLEVDPLGTITANESDLFVTGWGDVDGTMTLVASDFFISDECDNAGTLNLLNGLMIGGPISNSGVLGLSASTVYAGGIVNDPGGRVNVSGEIYSDVTNDGDLYCLGDTLVVGTYTNNGTTTVQLGTLTIVGTLINNGTIIGDVVNGFREGTQPGDGFSIAGDYVAGAGAALLLADPVWAFDVGGDYDVAIDDHARYHMAEAGLRMAGAWQSLELMSVDIGADRAGLDRTFAGHYPVGTLVIESGATVSMVDAHDNDGLGQALCEVLYVRHLDLAPGATLNTLGCVVYYETALLDGAIDDPANVIMLPPPCPWDCDGSGDEQVSVTDFLAMLAQWGQVGAACDFDDDGVGVVDFLALLGHWGPCP